MKVAPATDVNVYEPDAIMPPNRDDVLPTHMASNTQHVVINKDRMRVLSKKSAVLVTQRHMSSTKSVTADPVHPFGIPPQKMPPTKMQPPPKATPVMQKTLPCAILPPVETCTEIVISDMRDNFNEPLSTTTPLVIRVFNIHDKLVWLRVPDAALHRRTRRLKSASVLRLSRETAFRGVPPGAKEKGPSTAALPANLRRVPKDACRPRRTSRRTKRSTAPL